MANKVVQQQLKEMLSEAITTLCKQCLRYEVDLSVEGLLGITLDDKDIMLINVQETTRKTIPQDKTCLKTASLDQYNNIRETIKPTVIAPSSCNDLEDVPEASGSENLGSPDFPLMNRNTKNSCATSDSTGNDVCSKDASKPSIELFTRDASGTERSGFFSSTVDQIIKEYESQTQGDVSSLIYLKRSRKRRRYPEFSPVNWPSVELEVSLPKPSLTEAVNLSIVKEEPVSPEHDNKRSTVQIPADRDGTEGRVPILPTRDCFGGSSAKQLKRKDALPESQLIVIPSRENMPENHLQWIPRLILSQGGCIVSCRVICRKFSHLRVDQVSNAMKAMSLPRGHAGYVGEHLQKGRIQVFFKCPPLLLQAEALEQYNMTIEKYTNYFFMSPKPSNGTPGNWSSYMSLMMENAPYSPLLFPLESVEIEPKAVQFLTLKQSQLQEKFLQSISKNGDVLGGFKDE